MTSEDMEKYRLLAAAKRRREARAWMRRWSVVTWQDFKEFTEVYVSPNGGESAFDEFMEIAQQEPGRGARFPSMVTDLEHMLRREIARTFRSLDNLSFVGSLDVGSDEDLPMYGHYNPTMLTGALREGAFVQVTGLPRQGKTGFACKLMEEWCKEEPTGHLITNIEFDPEPPRYHHVLGARDLFLAFADCLEGDVPFVWALDDAALAGTQRMDTVTSRAKRIGLVWRDVGKMKGRVIYVEQLAAAVPTIIETFSRMVVVCESPGVVSIETYDAQQRRKWGIHVQGFPKTGLAYDTRQRALFAADDINIQKLLDMISAFPQKDQTKAIREFLRTDMTPTPKEEPAWHGVVDALGDLTNADAAAQAGVSESSVAIYRRERRRRGQQQENR